MMKLVKLVDPFRCCMWALHDRLEDHITEDSCKAEIESFIRHGQVVPVLGRPVRGDPLYDVELIFGARRLFVARHLNRRLAVEVRDMSDREAIVAMDIENRQRTDISAYERGRSYAQWLGSGRFDSQDDIASALNVSAARVSRLLKIARLPSLIVNAFGSATDICESWGLNLMDMWDDPVRRTALEHRASALGNRTPRPPAREVYQELMSIPGNDYRPPRRARDEIVRDRRGKALFHIRNRKRSIALVFPMKNVSELGLHCLRDTVVHVLCETDGPDGEAGAPRQISHPHQH